MGKKVKQSQAEVDALRNMAELEARMGITQTTDSNATLGEQLTGAFETADKLAKRNEKVAKAFGSKKKK